jgi:hypothetical protein
LTIPVTVRNTTARSIHILLRPETIGLVATGPFGTTRCQWSVSPSAIPELFTSLPPNASATTEVLVSSLCPAEFFDRTGLYALRALVDTRRVSGEPVGIRSFSGEVESTSATWVRMRTISKPGMR